RWSPDIILYIGTAYSIAEDRLLLNLIRQRSPHFYINCQLNFENCRPISNEQSKIVNLAYQLARRILFVSKRNLETASRHLVNSLENGMIVRNPVNLPDTTLIAYPPMDEIVQLAIVGNLITVHKGQDLMLQLLSNSSWNQRKWHLNIYGKGMDENYLK